MVTCAADVIEMVSTLGVPAPPARLWAARDRHRPRRVSWRPPEPCRRVMRWILTAPGCSTRFPPAAVPGLRQSRSRRGWTRTPCCAVSGCWQAAASSSAATGAGGCAGAGRGRPWHKNARGTVCGPGAAADVRRRGQPQETTRAVYGESGLAANIAPLSTLSSSAGGYALSNRAPHHVLRLARRQNGGFRSRTSLVSGNRGPPRKKPHGPVPGHSGAKAWKRHSSVRRELRDDRRRPHPQQFIYPGFGGRPARYCRGRAAPGGRRPGSRWQWFAATRRCSTSATASPTSPPGGLSSEGTDCSADRVADEDDHGGRGDAVVRTGPGRPGRARQRLPPGGPAGPREGRLRPGDRCAICSRTRPESASGGGAQTCSFTPVRAPASRPAPSFRSPSTTAAVSTVDVEPGTRWVYSNHGFAALGQIVEDVSGEPFDQYLRRHVFRPLGMDSTGRVLVRAAARGLATGYTLAADEDSTPTRHGGTHPRRRRSTPPPPTSRATSPRRSRRRERARTGARRGQHPDDVPAAVPARPPGGGHGAGVRAAQGTRPPPHLQGRHDSGFLSALEMAPQAGVRVVVLTNTGGLDNRGVAEPLAAALTRRLLGVPDNPVRDDIAPTPRCGTRARRERPDAGPGTNLFARVGTGAGVRRPCATAAWC